MSGSCRCGGPARDPGESNYAFLRGSATFKRDRCTPGRSLHNWRRWPVTPCSSLCLRTKSSAFQATTTTTDGGETRPAFQAKTEQVGPCVLPSGVPLCAGITRSMSRARPAGNLVDVAGERWSRSPVGEISADISWRGLSRPGEDGRKTSRVVVSPSIIYKQTGESCRVVLAESEKK